jgi:hypothetical protein
MIEPGRLPTLHIVADSIPQAYYQAICAVWKHGATIRTEYDRKNDAGRFIDPPSRDARVLIEVTNPFSQPRFAPLSFCEIGVYLAEIMGAKNGRVLPLKELVKVKQGAKVPTTHWPYAYHQRLTAWPELVPEIICTSEIFGYKELGFTEAYTDQLAMAIEAVAKTPYTRRAMCTTAIPNLDPYLTEDIPCLRELQLRCPEDEEGNLVLNVSATWRSRDLYKAWGDNVIAIAFLLEAVAKRIQELSGRPCRVGSYADYSGSLHIYGQDFGAVAGDEKKGLSSFFDNFPSEEAFVAKSLDSDTAKEMLVLPQLLELLSPKKIEEWQFDDTARQIIIDLIGEIKDGTLTA